MKWHFEDIPFLIYNLPRAVHDLLYHEDAELVQKFSEKIKFNSSPAKISIEKSIDPAVQRDVQNVGLLLHDYVARLPDFDLSSAESRKLLEHWQKLVTEQPQRSAQAHLGHMHGEAVYNFWQGMIAEHHCELGLTPERFSAVWEDWQRASLPGVAGYDPSRLPAVKQKQWQDLVIRSRLHKDTVARWDQV